MPYLQLKKDYDSAFLLWGPPWSTSYWHTELHGLAACRQVEGVIRFGQSEIDKGIQDTLTIAVCLLKRELQLALLEPGPRVDGRQWWDDRPLLPAEALMRDIGRLEQYLRYENVYLACLSGSDILTVEKSCMEHVDHERNRQKRPAKR